MVAYLSAILTSLLTLAIFSRILGPNRVFRWATYLLLGLGAGYIAAIVIKQVILPAFAPTELHNSRHLAIVLAATLLSFLLILRFSARPQVKSWGLLPLGLVAGVGGALSLAGAMRGSLLPQLMSPLQMNIIEQSTSLNGLSIIIATITTFGVLLYLLPNMEIIKQWSADKSWFAWLLYGWRLLGYWALMLAIGVLLASTAGARLTLLIDRVQYLLRLLF